MPRSFVPPVVPLRRIYPEIAVVGALRAMNPPVHRPGRVGLILACLPILVLAQSARAAIDAAAVSGRVSNEDGIGILYANVLILGAQLGAQSDSNGHFAFPRVPDGTYTMRVHAVGYQSIERPNIHVKANGTTKVNFSMSPKYPMRVRPFKVRADSVRADPANAGAFDARVIWVQGDRAYLASKDSLWLGPGAGLRFQENGKEIATGEVTAVHNATLIVALITSGSLKAVKRLDRLRVTSERDIVKPVAVLRVGYPSHKRVNPLFECVRMAFDAFGFRADTLGERSFRLVRDSTWVPPRPEPDTLHIRLFDDATDEEVALERGDLDVAIFWPGEASTHIRDVMHWDGRPDVLRRRGVVTSRADSNFVATWGTVEEDRKSLRLLNRELFRGDLRGPFGSVIWMVNGQVGPALFEVDSTCPGHQALGRFLNRDIKAGTETHRIFLSCLDIPAEIERDTNTSGWTFFMGCPVISRPALRPYLDAIDLYSLVNLFDCRTAGRKP